MRERLGVTQVQFSHMLGVHPVTISKWERGEAAPTAYNTQQLHLLTQGAEQMDADEWSKFLKLVALGAFVGALAFAIAIAIKNYRFR